MTYLLPVIAFILFAAAVAKRRHSFIYFVLVVILISLYTMGCYGSCGTLLDTISVVTIIIVIASSAYLQILYFDDE